MPQYRVRFKDENTGERHTVNVWATNRREAGLTGLELGRRLLRLRSLELVKIENVLKPIN